MCMHNNWYLFFCDAILIGLDIGVGFITIILTTVRDIRRLTTRV